MDSETSKNRKDAIALKKQLGSSVASEKITLIEREKQEKTDYYQIVANAHQKSDDDDDDDEEYFSAIEC